MAKNTRNALGEHFVLEEREAKLSLLRDAVRQGLESGPGTPFEIESFLARKTAEQGGA